jgi:hypothetical protein
MRALLGAILLLGFTSHACAEIWECVDKDTGAKRYTNIRGDAKGCRALNLEPLNTVPAPKSSQRMADFPSVDSETQRQRDVDRRRILDQELEQEQQLLLQAKKDLDEQQAVRNADEKNYARVQERLEPFERAVKLHEDNIANLKKEIASVK